MTGMPARTSASMIRAVRTPPSTLTAWAPASRRKIAGVVERLVGRRVGQERHVADDQRALRAADDGLACGGPSRPSSPARSSRSRARPGRANRRRGSSGCRPRRGSGRSGSRRRSASGCAAPSAYSLAMSTTVRRRMVSDVALMLGSRSGSVRARQSARRRRARPARRRPGRAARSATARFAQQRQVLARAVGGRGS